MSAHLPLPIRPNIDHIVTEDDTPVDGLYSEKQFRLLVHTLYSSWRPDGGRRFAAMANVGLFYGVNKPPIVPDCLLSMDVETPDDLLRKEHRSYFVWEYGKAPEVTVEVVSNLEGEELGQKKTIYARIGVAYYVVWAPEKLLGKGRLSIFALGEHKKYKLMKDAWFPEVGLGVTIWHGEFEGVTTDWLRWCDEPGNVIPTADEHAEVEKDRAERLSAQLRALGVKPKE
ncbi:MAG: Uma2 family endonuclease [Gemmataceae bacterium]|nr:Uma2 family endonuclease [Gemmataceae bacterium]MCI0738193.1 Uma2 family endonuclease [Gemmataceae bacterium]